MKYISTTLSILISLFLTYSCNQPTNSSTNQENKGMEVSPTSTSSDSVVEENQQQKKKRKSPLREVEGEIGGVRINLQYGSPGVKDRKIFGELVPYGQVWRTGANEATTIAFDQDVLIGGNKLEQGKYGLFTIPLKDEPWVIVFNEEWDQWGAFDYDTGKDALRVEVSPHELETFVEWLTFVIDEDDNKIRLQWANTEIPITIEPVN